MQINTNGYQSFRNATGGNHQDLPGRIMSMYIIQEDLFYDVEFHSWTSNNNGGGFSYTRTPAQINSFDYGPNAIYFEKQDYADWNNVNNQDRITDSTWITRGNQQGIFNAFSEQNYEFNGGDEIYSAPSNTLWAYGNTDEVSEEEYKPFKSAVQDIISLQDLPGNTFSLFLVSLFDVIFDLDATNNLTSLSITLPLRSLPVTWLMSTPSSLANFRTFGLADDIFKTLLLLVDCSRVSDSNS